MPTLRVTAAALLLAAAPLAAQDTLRVTLADAVRMAQDRSHQSRAARAARDASRARGSQFSALLLPQLSLAGTLPQYNRSIISVLQPDGSTQFRGQQQTNASLSMRLTQKLPITGGDLFVSSSLARLGLSGTTTTETWSSVPLSIGLRQDIFRPNTAGWDRREQNVREERDERTYHEAMEDVALTTTDLLFGVYAARVALHNAESNATVNDTLYRINTGRYEVGKIGENDLLQSQLALLRSRSSLEAAQLEYQRALAALRLGLGLQSDVALDVTMPAVVPEFEADTTRAVTEARRNRAAVSDAELSDVQARRRVAEARLANGIGATIQASYGYNATGPQASLAYQNLLEARQFSVSVQLPLWQWGAHGAGVRAAEADRERAESQSEQSLEQVTMDARFAALQLTQARHTVALLKTADSVASVRFTVAYNRYVIGRISVDNLYIAQNEKDQALTQFVDGLRRYWQAYYRLRRVTLYDFEAGRAIR